MSGVGQAMLLPSAAMALMTLGLILRMGAMRFRATARREVSLGYYRLYSDGQEPPALRVMTRHVQNHFELPPLFHLACLGLFASATANGLSLALAWGFVASRALHSVIHLGSNNVRHRFFCYGLGLLLTTALWLQLLLGLLRAG